MPDPVVVCNTSPLLYLHQVSQLELLRRLYGEVRIPPAVRAELRAGAEQGIDVPRPMELPWIRIEAVLDSTLVPAILDLGSGEAEAIALARQTPGSLLILDDALGRTVAQRSGLVYTGTLGILVKAKQKGLLAEVRPILEQLLTTTMYLSGNLIALVLAEAGES